MDKKWNLQDIKPAGERQSKKPASKTRTAMPVAQTHKPRKERKGGGSSKKLLIGLICLGIIALGLGVNVLLGGAEVQVKPRNREVTINSELTAYKEPKVGELGYEILTLEAEGERQVTAVGQEPASEQATGEITIYKTTPDSERLIKNTRFESPEGLVFRTTESVVVPGATGDTPGSVTVSVFADEPGEEYNIGKTKFTIPGFKEGGYDSLFNSMYAENNSAFTGGFEGTKFILDDSDLEKAQGEVREELRQALVDRLPEEKPAGTVMFENSMTYSYESLPAVESGGDKATIREKVFLKVPLFKQEDFASYLASAVVPGYEGEPVRIDDYSSLSFAYTSASTTASNIANLNEVKFDLSGKTQLIWVFDEESLKEDLAGKSRTAIVNILAAYPSIENTKIIIRPFWKRTLPDNMDKVEIVESLDLSTDNQ